MSQNGFWYVTDSAERRRGQKNKGAAPNDGFVEQWGYPVWSDEPANRLAYGTTVDPSKWNIRDVSTFGNTPDYATINASQVSVDLSGIMHLKAEWLNSPIATLLGGGTATFAADNTITTPSDHGLGTTSQVYVDVLSGSGIVSGYYYIKAVPGTTSITLTQTCDIWPGTIGAEYDITGTGTCNIYTHRWMKTGYVDHRALNSGDIAPVEQQYGRWEMKAKVPVNPTNTRGALAAFWLRNTGTIVAGGNTGGEIDIMESWGSGPDPKYNPGTSTITAHNYTSTPSGGVYEKWATTYDGSTNDAHIGWHTWTFEKTPDYVRAYRDGVKVVDATPSSEPRWWGSTFTDPMHVRINLHVGASTRYWGLPDPNNKSWTQEPLDYQVDYVRIWSYNP